MPSRGEFLKSGVAGSKHWKLVRRHESIVGCSYRLPVFGKRLLCITWEKRFLNTGKRWLHHSTRHLIRGGVLEEVGEEVVAHGLEVFHFLGGFEQVGEREQLFE